MLAGCFAALAVGCGFYTETQKYRRYYTSEYYETYFEVSQPYLGVGILLGFVAFILGAIALFGVFEEKEETQEEKECEDDTTLREWIAKQ